AEQYKAQEDEGQRLQLSERDLKEYGREAPDHYHEGQRGINAMDMYTAHTILQVPQGMPKRQVNKWTGGAIAIHRGSHNHHSAARTLMHSKWYTMGSRG